MSRSVLSPSDTPHLLFHTSYRTFSHTHLLTPPLTHSLITIYPGVLVTGAAEAAWPIAAQTIKTLLQPQTPQQATSLSSPKPIPSPKRVSTQVNSSSAFSPTSSSRAGGGSGSSSSSSLHIGNYNFAAAAATAATTTTGYHAYDLHDTDTLKQVD